MKKQPILSIVIVSFNTKKLTVDCIQSIINSTENLDYEIIVIDNASSDGSVSDIRKLKDKIIRKQVGFRLIENKDNLGFAKANNQAREYSSGKYVLFLNSDTIVYKDTLKKTVGYLEENKKTASVTCKTVLPNGSLDKDARRSFPTPWVAFTHLVLPLDRLFPKSKLFSRYWYGFVSEDTTHEIDVVQGAFHLTRKKVLDDVGWFDEDYFLDGEDIDLCWKIKERGWKIVYFPDVHITHIKKASKKNSAANRKRTITTGVDSMGMFYKKRMWDKYPLPINLLVLIGIRSVKLVRFIKISTRR